MDLTYLEPTDRLKQSSTQQSVAERPAPFPSTDVLHQAELVGLVRERLGVDQSFPDAAILASLETVMRCSDPRGRWRAAFDSALGRWLAFHGSDLNTSLSTVVALLPKPLS